MESKELYLSLPISALNETTKDLTEGVSSSDKLYSFFFFYSTLDASTSNTYKAYASIEANNSFSELDRLAVRRNALDDEAKKDKIVKKLVRELELELDLFDEENEEFSSAERKIIQIEHSYSMRILGEVIQNVYIRHFEKPLYLVGICRSLLRYDLDEVKPWGVALLAGLLNHPDERVIEYTIQLIDNWRDVELLPILKTLQVSANWLRDYINDVVESLEKKNVLFEKTIKT